MPLVAALAVLQPDGWVRDYGLPSKLYPTSNSGLEIAVFHPPEDLHTLFVVAHAKGVGAMAADTADWFVDRVMANETATVVSRSSRSDRGRVISDAQLTVPDGASIHLHVTYGLGAANDELYAVVCRGRGAQMQACDARLAMISVPVDPSIDGSNVKWALALIAACVLGLGVLVGIVRGVLRRRDLTRSARLVDGEAVTIAGVVRVVGEPLCAPLSGQRCVMHQSRAHVRGAAPQQPAIERGGVPFIIETKRGPVRVDAIDDIELALAPLNVLDRNTDLQRAFLARHHANGAHGYDEIVIAPGANVTVRGVIRLERDRAASGERGYRDDAPAVTMLVSPISVTKVW